MYQVAKLRKITRTIDMLSKAYGNSEMESKEFLDMTTAVVGNAVDSSIRKGGRDSH